MKININKIKTGLNPRIKFDLEDLQQLADTYKTQGIIVPLEVDEKHRLIIGERRLRAAKLAGIGEVPIIIKKGLTNEEILERQCVEEAHKKSWNDIERAKAWEKLLQMQQLSKRGLARRLGVADSTIVRTLQLLEADKELQERVREGIAKPSHVRAIYEEEDEELRGELVEAYKEDLEETKEHKEDKDFEPRFATRNKIEDWKFERKLEQKPKNLPPNIDPQEVMSQLRKRIIEGRTYYKTMELLNKYFLKEENWDYFNEDDKQEVKQLIETDIDKIHEYLDILKRVKGMIKW